MAKADKLTLVTKKSIPEGHLHIEHNIYYAIIKPSICRYTELWDLETLTRIKNPFVIPKVLITYMANSLCYECIYNAIIENLTSLRINVPDTVIDIQQPEIIDTISDTLITVKFILNDFYKLFDSDIDFSFPFPLPAKNPKTGEPIIITYYIDFYQPLCRKRNISARFSVLYTNSIGEWANIFTICIHQR